MNLTIEKTLNALANVLLLFGGILMVLMMLQITLSVLGRYLISQPIPGTLEVVSSYYMVGVVFFPLWIRGVVVVLGSCHVRLQQNLVN